MRVKKNVLGDPLIGTYAYKFGSGYPVKIKEEPLYSTAPLAEKEAPEEILNDPNAREPILKIIGAEYFAKFRDAMEGYLYHKGIRIVDGNFVIGKGLCPPIDCPDTKAAMFVLDIANQLAWAVEGYEIKVIGETPTARIWGPLTSNDVVPKREIKTWLGENNIREGNARFVSLPDDIALLYKLPRKQIAVTKPEVSSPAAINAPPLATSQSPPYQTQGEFRSGISLQKQGDTFVVPVTINGEMTLDFTLDSGASDVSIPIDVVLTLLRTGSLTHDDFRGSQNYRLADGSTIPSRTFRIRSLKVGGRVVEDVVGSIAPAAGSLLLGQSFLSKFKSWSIDNQRQMLLLGD